MATFLNQSTGSESAPQYLVVAGASTLTGDSFGGFNNTTGNFDIVPFNLVEAESQPGMFDANAHQYTIPEDGIYEVSGHMRIRDTSNYDAAWRIVHDSQGNVTYSNQQWGYGIDTSSDRTFILDCTAGDIVYMEFQGLFYDAGSMVIKKI